MIDLLPLPDAWEAESTHGIGLPPKDGQDWRVLLLEVNETLYPMTHRAENEGRHVQWAFWESACGRHRPWLGAVPTRLARMPDGSTKPVYDLFGGDIGGGFGFDRRIETTEGDELLRDNPALVARWLLLAYQTDKPNAWHYEAAAAALVTVGVENIEKRNDLAEAMRRECSKLVVPESADLATFNDAVLKTLERLGKPDGELLELRGRVADKPLYFWADNPSNERGTTTWRFVRFGKSLALAIWALSERDRAAPSIIEAASTSIGGYSGIPRIAAPMSWAFGGPGISAATVNGDSYALEPEAAASALVPRSFVLTGNMKQPERFNLPLELDPPMPLAIQVTDATGYALTPHAGKLALIIMAHDRAMGGRVYRWTLDALVKSLNPGGRRIESRHYRPVADGLEQLSKLHAFLPTGQKYRVFYATGLLADPSTAHARKDAEVVLGIDPVFSALTREWGGARGYFLINLDGAMRLDNREPVALRTYVRVAALWNTIFKPGGEPDPERMKPTRIDEIGLMANNYRHGTVELLQAQGEKKQAGRARMALSEDREKTRDTLKKLAAGGLLTLKETDATGARVGKHELVILPPEEYVEAWRRHRHPKR